MVQRLSGLVKNACAAMIHILWPAYCPACGRVGAPFCDECLSASATGVPDFCLSCGAVYGHACCSSSAPCSAAAIHAGSARSFLLSLKYGGERSLGVPMGRIMGSRLAPSDCLLVPIPLHRGSSRMYNQTLLLARGISEVTPMKISDCLEWRAAREPQTGRSGAERRSLPPSAFRLKFIPEKPVVIVDDVYTSGGTMRAAKKALEERGVRVSGGAVWARRVTYHESAAAWRGIKDGVYLK